MPNNILFGPIVHHNYELIKNTDVVVPYLYCSYHVYIFILIYYRYTYTDESPLLTHRKGQPTVGGMVTGYTDLPIAHKLYSDKSGTFTTVQSNSLSQMQCMYTVWLP